MKLKNIKWFKSIVLLGIIFVSCNDGEPELVADASINDEVVTTITEDDITEDVENIVDDYFYFDTDMAAKSATVDEKKPSYLNCSVKTIVIDGTTKTVTLDFGEGCTMPNGNILKGKIIITHTVDITAASIVANLTYVDFYVNDTSIEGQSSILKVKENEQGNPQSTITFEKKITWADGTFVSKTGVKVKEWIEGYDTRDWEDNVFLITGNWAANYNNEITISATVIDALRREATCKYIVSGVLKVEKNNAVGTINFGDGTCDNLAIYTDDSGNETEITLKGKGF